MWWKDRNASSGDRLCTCAWIAPYWRAHFACRCRAEWILFQRTG